MMRIPPRLAAVAVGAFALIASACQPQTPAPAPAAPTPSTFTFSGGGFGHGVGMSQYGALGRAQAGHSATDILGAYFPGSAVENRPQANIRVHLADATSSDLINPSGAIMATASTGGDVTLSAAGQVVRVSHNGSAIVAQNLTTAAAPVTLSAKAWFWTNGAEPISLSSTGNSYRYGRIQATISSNRVRFVESDLPMERYLYGLNEVPFSWPIEALKAQAIAGRSYAAIRLASPKSADFDIYSSTVDQVYAGATPSDTSAYGANWKAAVDQSANLVLVSGGSIVQAYYSSSNGGHTEFADYVWTSNLGYIAATPDPFDAVAANPNATWTRSYSAEELGRWIAAAGRGDVGVVTSIAIGGNIGASGRLDKATITVAGTKGTTSLTGNQLRSAINNSVPSSRQLRSTLFSIAEAAPVDTTPPKLQLMAPNPIRYGTNGRVCALVSSDEPTIYALAIKIDGVETKSPVGGVGPGAITAMCFNIPARLRTNKVRTATLTAVGIDAAQNYGVAVQQVTVRK